LRRLEGRVAVVTGAASGIGAATVRRFEREGAHVVRVDLTETDGDFVKRDVSDEDQVRALFDGVVQRHGRGARRRVRLPTQRVKELCFRSPWDWVFSSPKAALE
jgi:NAD(P)-dependent dehydrogenase (short-subunit alcohol dehydrogenase family)